MGLQPFFDFAVLITCALLYGWSPFLAATPLNQPVGYIYYTQPMSWNGARQVCQSIGGDLAKIDSQQTINLLKLLHTEAGYGPFSVSSGFWTGLHFATAERREWALDCSELTFVSMYEPSWYMYMYDPNTRCYLVMTGSYPWQGQRRSCGGDMQAPFLCEIRGEEGTCPYNAKQTEASIVDCVNDFTTCEDHCAHDSTCRAALYVPPSVCYKLTSMRNTVNTSVESFAALSFKSCFSFSKNTTLGAYLPTPIESKVPLGNCSAPVSNQSSAMTTPSLPCSTSVTPPLPVPPATVTMTHSHTTTMTTTALTTITDVEMTTITPSTCTSPQMSTATSTTTNTKTTQTNVDVTTVTTQPSAWPFFSTMSTETTTAWLTQTETRTLTPCLYTTAPEITTTTITQTATTTLTSYVNTMAPEITATTVTATHSLPLPSISVTPSVTTMPTPSPNKNMTNQEAEQIAEEISKNLTVDAKQTSSYVRSLISAPDDRKSSVAIGTVGVMCLAVILALVMSTDLTRVYAFVRSLLE